MIEQNESVSFQLKNIICTSKTKTRLIDTIHFYLIFRKKSARKPYFLSKAAQRYQTITINDVILKQKLTEYESIEFLHNIVLNVFEHQIQNDTIKYVKFNSYSIKLFIEAYPMLYINKSNLFQLLFNTKISKLSI